MQLNMYTHINETEKLSNLHLYLFFSFEDIFDKMRHQLHFAQMNMQRIYPIFSANKRNFEQGNNNDMYEF